MEHASSKNEEAPLVLDVYFYPHDGVRISGTAHFSKGATVNVMTEEMIKRLGLKMERYRGEPEPWMTGMKTFKPIGQVEVEWDWPRWTGEWSDIFAVVEQLSVPAKADAVFMWALLEREGFDDQWEKVKLAR